MATRKKAWSKVVKEHGVKVRIFERGGTIYRDVTLGRTTSSNGNARTKHDIRSLGHKDRALAETQAKDLCKHLAEARLTGIHTGKGLTIGQLFMAYRQHKAPGLSDDWSQAAETRIDLFLRAWGRDLPAADVGQSQVDAYCRKRRSLDIVPRRFEEPEEGEKPGRGYRRPQAVRDGTLDADFRWLSSTFNWARRHKVDGRRLMVENPLHDVKWPKEKNVRRPVASHQRYTRTQEHTGVVDSKGRLRCILALARYTGRRESAICELRVSDLLLTSDRVQNALAAAGMDERIAEHMPHGAIRWAEESDKQGLLFVSPLSNAAREALDDYLRGNPRIGDAVLFPAPGDADAAIDRDCASKWLLRAETLAKLPKLDGGVFHPYRRLWASERKHLPDVDVAAAGGWKDTRALKLSYQQADAATVLAVVQNGS